MQNPIEFSRRSRRAILLFVALMLLLVLIPRTYYWINPPAKISFHQTPFERKQFQHFEFKKWEKKKFQSRTSRFTKPNSKFDPNEYGVSDWMILGLSQKQAEIVVKFKKYGFYSEKDLQRVFVISEPFWNNIKDSLVFPVKPSYAKNFNARTNTTASKVIELNVATEDELLNLKGIGPFFAKKIIEFRTKLGGFIAKEQLLEIWKFDEEKLNLIAASITVDPDLMHPILINEVTVEELKNHPYFTWNVANSIVKLRSQLGGYKRIEEIKKSVLVTDEVYQKVKPYLKID
jgi:competence protein ComEA